MTLIQRNAWPVTAMLDPAIIIMYQKHCIARKQENTFYTGTEAQIANTCAKKVIHITAEKELSR